MARKNEKKKKSGIKKFVIPIIVVIALIFSAIVLRPKDSCSSFTERHRIDFSCDYLLLGKELPKGYSISKDSFGSYIAGKSNLQGDTFGPNNQLEKWQFVIYENGTDKISLNVLSYNSSYNKSSNIKLIESMKKQIEKNKGFGLSQWEDENRLIILLSLQGTGKEAFLNISSELDKKLNVSG